MKFLFLIFILTGSTGCFSLSKRIKITSSYVINENWNKKGERSGSNAIEIIKLNLKKDSTLNPFSNPPPAALTSKLKPDSSFWYVANVKIGKHAHYKNKKIYFNQDNGFYWWTPRGETRVKTIGKLQQNTWYEISRLTYYYHIVYIDSAGNAHPFIINPSNW